MKPKPSQPEERDVAEDIVECVFMICLSALIAHDIFHNEFKKTTHFVCMKCVWNDKFQKPHIIKFLLLLNMHSWIETCTVKEFSSREISEYYQITPAFLLMTLPLGYFHTSNLLPPLLIFSVTLNSLPPLNRKVNKCCWKKEIFF